MQCPSCGFQNMPGSEGCVRCGSSLNVATMLIDVHPPRRAGRGGAMRRVWSLRWTWAGLRDRMARAYRAFVKSRTERFHYEGTASGLVWRLPVPGWAHFYAGQVWEACFFLGAFALFFMRGLLEWGTTGGAVMLGAAFLIHQTAVLDVLHQFRPDRSFEGRVNRSLQAMGFLAVCVYLPAYLLLTAVAEPMTLQYPVGPIWAGDVVLINHWTTARPGQVVLYDLPIVNLPGGRREQHERVYIQEAGVTIDRVLAVGGDQIVWADGKLLVNGVQSPWLPLNPQALPGRLSLEVPAGDVLIFPTAMMWTPSADDGSAWSSISLVQRGWIRGTLYYRWQPVGRRGAIR